MVCVGLTVCGGWGLGFGVWGLGFRVWGLGFRVWMASEFVTNPERLETG